MKMLALAVPLVLLMTSQQSFRSVTDAVFVDVSVMSGRNIVAGLTAADFALTDNDVEQRIESVEIVSVPIDLTVVADSGEGVAAVAKSVNAAAGIVQTELRPDDKSRLISFDSQVRAGPPVVSAEVRGDRGTVLFDAVVTAAMLPVEAGRRHVVLVVTGGLDSHSFVDRETRLAILSRTNAAILIVAIATKPRSFIGVRLPGSQYDAGSYDWLLREVCDATGGRFYDLQPDVPIARTLRGALDGWRTRYVLRYQPAGVAASGWHSLDVKILKPGKYDITAKRGYWRQ